MGLGDTNPEMLASPIVFTARRDAIHSIASLSQDVYPSVRSVRPSVCHRVATPFWLFHTKRYANIATETPLTVASDQEKHSNFRPVSHFISETIQDLAMRTGNCIQAFEWYHFQ